MKKTLHLTLDTALDDQRGLEPLSELLTRAAKCITAEGMDRDKQARWLVRNVVRAACKELLATRSLPCPVKVRFISTPGHLDIGEEPENDPPPKPRFRHYRN